MDDKPRRRKQGLFTRIRNNLVGINGVVILVGRSAPGFTGINKRKNKSAVVDEPSAEPDVVGAIRCPTLLMSGVPPALVALCRQTPIAIPPLQLADPPGVKGAVPVCRACRVERCCTDELRNQLLRHPLAEAGIQILFLLPEGNILTK
jgi:hypothetical protein